MARSRNQITYATAAPAAVEDAVVQLGRQISVARLRRGWRQSDLAQKAGITRATLVGIEHGKLGTGIGAYVAVLWALGLHDAVTRIAAPETDAEGLSLEAARLTRRARPSTALDDDF
ncbi:MAG TPA: helix-turn-helix domain-containing protein [Longimicrobium sp.]|jgi:transcriptional regulator with XRE-family HTH domain|uniref:helix-turn-helix transcriptional regulator n=1 Tax=Longimicrobium sp. TaxID=2029185 RepID=UPI002F0F4618